MGQHGRPEPDAQPEGVLPAVQGAGGATELRETLPHVQLLVSVTTYVKCDQILQFVTRCLKCYPQQV